MQIENEKIIKAVREILSRGNVAEVRNTKDGVMVFEIRRKQMTGK